MSTQSTSKNKQAPLIPVSWGELFDKITILEIKRKKITSEEAQKNIQYELSTLLPLSDQHSGDTYQISSLKNQLKEINLQLWVVEDEIRDKDHQNEFDEIFIKLARSVYHLNDQRAQIKREINDVLFSTLIEEKSYQKHQKT